MNNEFKVIDKYEGHRLDHPAFRHVYDTTYKIGKVIGSVDKNDEDDNDFHLKVKFDDDEEVVIPVFYHCGKDVEKIKEHALKGGAFSFWKFKNEEEDLEVIVACVKDEPFCVVGFADYKPHFCCTQPLFHKDEESLDKFGEWEVFEKIKGDLADIDYELVEEDSSGKFKFDISTRQGPTLEPYTTVKHMVPGGGYCNDICRSHNIPAPLAPKGYSTGIIRFRTKGQIIPDHEDPVVCYPGTKDPIPAKGFLVFKYEVEEFKNAWLAVWVRDEKRRIVDGGLFKWHRIGRWSSGGAHWPEEDVEILSPGQEHRLRLEPLDPDLSIGEIDFEIFVYNEHYNTGYCGMIRSSSVHDIVYKDDCRCYRHTESWYMAHPEVYYAKSRAKGSLEYLCIDPEKE